MIKKENKRKLLEIYAKASKPAELFVDLVEKIQENNQKLEKIDKNIDNTLSYVMDNKPKSEEELVQIIYPLIPKPVHGRTPTKGELVELIVPLIPQPIHGKDGNLIKPEEVRDKIASLQGKERLSVFSLKDTEYLKGGEGKMQWNAVGALSKVSHDTTLSGDGTATSPLSVVSGGGFTLLPATGSIDGSNVSFTFTSKPTYLVIDGLWKRENVGWTWNVLTATLTVPPNDDIWGFK